MPRMVDAAIGSKVSTWLRNAETAKEKLSSTRPLLLDASTVIVECLLKTSTSLVQVVSGSIPSP